MSSVVLYRVIAPTGVATICAKNVAENSYESLPLSGVCIAGELAHASPWIVEPVEYVPASVARGLVEALKEVQWTPSTNGGRSCEHCLHFEPEHDARCPIVNALVAAEEALK